MVDEPTEKQDDLLESLPGGDGRVLVTGAEGGILRETGDEIEGVLGTPEQRVKSFLEDYLRDDDYAKMIVGISRVGEGVDVFERIKQVYEKTGVDLAREALYQYRKVNGELSNDMLSHYPNLSDVYDDPRLHSQSDFTLGEYIDGWREKNVSDDEKFWCEMTEKVRMGLKRGERKKIVKMFSELMGDLDEKPDSIILAPSAKVDKPVKQYQMYDIGKKLSKSTKVKYEPELLKRTESRGRVEQFQGDEKYFGRRSLIDGTLSGNESDIRGKTILVLDDGWSSGSTYDEMKKYLYLNGANKVITFSMVRC
ncbi:hypothetical protein HOG17_01210 [Candidatus Peregrinibacteria bacterium]|nr:hypothetical protein [Candidatus Peregrinibacteria bacterium]MBT4147943.1 hypothetical protein [Candidatus Peregrinibacteria bacterium]MBT4366531.1 hypothetical protein [Candidatus Peregrinibacteria bacterium]MBT4456163.1 hypothetical protein [Candidatus Peregrinibacteria bacterium]